MKKLSLFLLTAGSFLFPVYSANPLGLPEYSREYTLTFRSPEEAQQAQLELTPFPAGKQVLFSCRWDDSTDRHLKTLEVMRSSGCRGTFYLCQAGPTYYAKTMQQLLAGGNTIGNHTLTHPRLTRSTQADLWREILKNRYEYESRSSFPVTAFALPFCAWREKDDPHAPARIGTALRNAGMLGAPEYWNQGKAYGYPEGCFIGSSLTTPGDKVPSEERFDSDVAAFLRQKAPHITLGMHSAHTPEGIEVLKRILKKSAERPDWHCCSENEAIARLLASRLTRVEKLGSRGVSARFRLIGPTPAALGDPAPLGAYAQGAFFELPHTLPMPRKILLFSGKNRKGLLLKHPETELFQAGIFVDPAGGTAQLRIQNTGNMLAEDLEITLRMPGFCSPGLQRKTVKSLAPGKTGSYDFAFSLLPDAAGKTPVAAEIDLKYGKDVYRLWAAADVDFLSAPPAVPRRKECRKEKETVVFHENFDAVSGRSAFSAQAKFYEKKGVDHSNCAVFRDAEKKALLLTVVIAAEILHKERTAVFLKGGSMCG